MIGAKPGGGYAPPPQRSAMSHPGRIMKCPLPLTPSPTFSGSSGLRLPLPQKPEASPVVALELHKADEVDGALAATCAALVGSVLLLI